MSYAELSLISKSADLYLSDSGRMPSAMQSLKQQDYFRPCAFAGFPGVVFPGKLFLNFYRALRFPLTTNINLLYVSCCRKCVLENIVAHYESFDLVM